MPRKSDGSPGSKEPTWFDESERRHEVGIRRAEEEVECFEMRGLITLPPSRPDGPLSTIRRRATRHVGRESLPSSGVDENGARARHRLVENSSEPRQSGTTLKRDREENRCDSVIRCPPPRLRSRRARSPSQRFSSASGHIAPVRDVKVQAGRAPYPPHVAAARS
jgi:hypothetical protein